MNDIKTKCKIFVSSVIFLLAIIIAYYWNGHILYKNSLWLMISISLAIPSIVYIIIDRPNSIKIYIWIQKRYDYYDKLFGGSYGDKYTEVVFEDASKYFNIPLDKLDDVYWKGVMVFSDKQQKKYEKRENKRLAKMEKKNKSK